MGRPATDWSAFDAVVIRSTWDCDKHRGEFIRWCDSVGPSLHNSAEVVRWNSDKRYLADLAAAGIPVVKTDYVVPAIRCPSCPVKWSSSRPLRRRARLRPFRPRTHDSPAG